MIKEANVTLMVTDIDRAVHFYVETLGLKLRNRYGNEFAQVTAPGTTIALHPISDQGPNSAPPERISIGFSVDHLDGVMSELKAKGVQFSRVTDDKQVRLAFFNDPDGYALYLSESKWG